MLVLPLGNTGPRRSAVLPLSYLRMIFSENRYPFFRDHALATLTQRFPRVTGNPLVAFRQCDQFVAADDVLDSGERSVLAALEHLAQDRIGRIAAVGEDDARGRFQALLFVGCERRDGIGDFAQ